MRNWSLVLYFFIAVITHDLKNMNNIIIVLQEKTYFFHIFHVLSSFLVDKKDVFMSCIEMSF